METATHPPAAPAAAQAGAAAQAAADTSGLDREVLLAGLEMMVRIRSFEDRVQREFARGEMPGFVHTYHGAEAVAAGVCAHLSEDDLITSTHRGHGHCIAKGCDLEAMVAELYGRETGLCAGRGGSMHIADFSRGMLGANAIVGGGIALATGAALAADTLGDGRVAVAFFGDGAANQGVLHESLNLAAIWRLPVVYVCENNGWAESTPAGYATSVVDVSSRAVAYGIVGVTVAGDDFEAVYTAACDAVYRARAGEGPTLLEAKVARIRGHYIGDPQQYRPRAERQEARRRDPVARLVEQLGTEAAPGRDAVASEIDAAFERGPRGAWPDPGTVERDVYAPAASQRAPVAAPPADREITFLEAVHEALRAAMAANDSVVVLGEDISGGGGLGGPHEGAMGGTFGATRGLLEAFGPQRVRDTPISEAGFVGAATGAALAGLRPVVDLMWASFAPLCFDQIFNQAAKMCYMFGGQTAVPLVLRMAVGAGLRAAGQHSDTLYTAFAGMPGLKVVAPSTPADAKGLLLRAIADDNPVVFLEHMGLYRTTGPVAAAPYEVALGAAACVRPGDDVSLVAVGECTLRALDAAEQLAGEGVSAEVIDVRSIAPLDAETICASVARTGRAVVVEESPRRCGLAAEIAAVISENTFAALSHPVARVTAANSPVPFSPPLEDAWLPTAADILSAVRAMA
ncbi:MAG: dehydrogenase E1 component subunit alpha/beta [bacterium]|nr:dehydrogenase E1 component subunit alpha/beta [bacterium]